MTKINRQNVYFILVEPQSPGNIGAAARALKTMGFANLVLINPCDYLAPEARWLAEHFAIHAMIDLSDGLAGDLRHVLKAGDVGAELLKSAIPISRAAKERGRVRKNAEAVAASRESAKAAPHPPTPGGSYKLPLLAALTDGEDFELLFTIASKDAVSLLDAWKKQFPSVRLTCIGRITADEKVVLRDKEAALPLPERGYVHFTQLKTP